MAVEIKLQTVRLWFTDTHPLKAGSERWLFLAHSFNTIIPPGPSRFSNSCGLSRLCLFRGRIIRRYLLLTEVLFTWIDLRCGKAASRDSLLQFMHLRDDGVDIHDLGKLNQPEKAHLQDQLGVAGSSDLLFSLEKKVKELLESSATDVGGLLL